MVVAGTDLSFLALSIFAGWLLASRLTLGLSAFERLVVGAISGLALSSWAAYLISLASGSMEASFLSLGLSVVAIAIVFGVGRNALIGITADFNQLANSLRSSVSKNKTTWIVFVLLAVWFGFLYANAWFPTDANGAIRSGGYVWGDGAFHSTVANSFLKAQNFPPEYPVYSGTRLGYPFLSNIQAAALLSLGAAPQVAFGLSGWLELMLALLAVFLLAKRVTQSSKVAITSVLLLVFNGGMGFLTLIDEFTKGGLNAALTLAGKSDLARIQSSNTLFTNFVTSVFMPQRPSAYGLAAVAAVFLVLIAVCPIIKSKLDENRTKSRSKIPLEVLALAGVLAASTVLFHAHSMIAFVILIGLFLFGAVWNSFSNIHEIAPALVNATTDTAPFWIPLLALGIPQALWSLPQLGTASFVRVQGFWLAKTFDPLAAVSFWTNNAGPFLLLVLLGIYWHKDDFAKWIWPFAALWLFANFVIVQPYDYDNLKLLLFAHAGLSVLAALALRDIWNARGIFQVKIPNQGFQLAAVLIFVVAVASGVQSTYWQSQQSNVLFSASTVSFASQLDILTPPRAVFLSGASHNHPVTALAGRSTVMGYRGWLWTHGFAYDQREKDVTAMYAGGTNAKTLLKKYGVTYAVIGPEENEFSPNTAFFSQYSVVLKEGERTVYKVA